MNLSGILLGPGLQLVTEDSVYAVFAPHSFTLPLFRSFLRSIGVRTIEGPAGIRYIWYESLLLCIAHTARPFGSDFSILDDPSPSFITEVPPRSFAHSWEETLGALLLAHSTSFSAPQAVREWLRASSERLASASAHAAATLSHASRQAAKNARNPSLARARTARRSLAKAAQPSPYDRPKTSRPYSIPRREASRGGPKKNRKQRGRSARP